jgi:hypothetical protein
VAVSEAAATEMAAGWQATHRGLSELDLRFREAARDSPELLDRARFRLLDEGSEGSEGSKLLRFPLQPWPTFVGAAKLAEIRRVSIEVCRLLRGVPERIFEHDPVKLAEFYRLPSPAIAEILFAPPTGADTMLARGDLIETVAGFQCIEFNFSPSLAGWDGTIITNLQLAAPATARFMAAEGVKPAFTDTLLEMFRHVIQDLRGKGVAGAGGLTIALLPDRKETAVIAEQLEYLNRELRRTIAAMGLDWRGRLVGCLPEQLVFQGGRLLLAAQQIDGVLELGGTPTPPHIYRPFKAGLIGLYNGPMGAILSDKRNLALLSLHAATAGYSPEEQAFIAAHVPWTRLVAPGAIDWQGKTQPLAELLAAEQPRFVLKKAGGHGGSGVVLGKFAAPERWREALATALREGDWVVQETLESLPYLYQSGDYGCSIHDVIWGPFVFGDRYGGVVLRMQPAAAGGPVNLTLHATEGIVLEV